MGPTPTTEDDGQGRLWYILLIPVCISLVIYGSMRYYHRRHRLQPAPSKQDNLAEVVWYQKYRYDGNSRVLYPPPSYLAASRRYRVKSLPAIMAPTSPTTSRPSNDMFLDHRNSTPSTLPLYQELLPSPPMYDLFGSDDEPLPLVQQRIMNTLMSCKPSSHL